MFVRQLVLFSIDVVIQKWYPGWEAVYVWCMGWDGSSELLDMRANPKGYNSRFLEYVRGVYNAQAYVGR